MSILKIRSYAREFLLKNPPLNPYRMFSNGFVRLVTSPLRKFPDFIIIGAAKSGTTSLYDYIGQHPEIDFLANYKGKSSLEKEIYFFDERFQLGRFWYKSHFSFIFSKKKIGEATPNYLHHPLAPDRIKKTIPNCKFIIILRNPVDRAYSDYNMKIRLNMEKLSFEDAIKLEEERLSGEREKILNNERYFSHNLTIYSYLNRGIYIDQIKTWTKLFPKKKILILQTEELELNPNKVLKQVFEFLNLHDFEVKNMTRKNTGSYKMMNPKTREWLIEYFKPHNERLYKYLGQNMCWDK